MTERFSEEYIKFVTNSKPIQAYWRKRGPKMGDWFVYYQKPSGESFVSCLGGSYLEEGWKQREYHCWVPSLSDLLDILESSLRERCGYAITFNEHESDTGQNVYRCYEITPLEWLEAIDDMPHRDKELAAARLLERVRAGKEERNVDM